MPKRRKMEKMKALFEDPQVQGWRLLMDAFQEVYKKLEAGLSQEQCTISRFQILLYLYFDGPLHAAQIARRLFVTRGNITMFMRRLMSEKLVEIEEASSSQGRPLFVLTRVGADFFERIFPEHISRVKSHMPALSPETKKEIIAILENASRS